MTGGTREAATVEHVSGDGRTVIVRALSYDSPDSFNTSWAPGCLTPSVRDAIQSGRGVPVCWGHDGRRIVGKVVSYSDSAAGLDLELRLANPEDVPDARMAQSLLRDGMIPGVSISFKDGVGEPDPRHRGVTRFRSAKLREISLVADPSVPGAHVLSMRSTVTDDEIDTELAALGWSPGEIAEMRAAWDQSERTEAIEAEAEASDALAKISLRCLDHNVRQTPDPRPQPRNVGQLPDVDLGGDFGFRDWQHAVEAGDRIMLEMPPRRSDGPADVEDYGRLVAAGVPPEVASHQAGGAYVFHPPMDEMPPPDVVACKPAGMSTEEMVRRWNAAKWLGHSA